MSVQPLDPAEDVALIAQAIAEGGSKVANVAPPQNTPPSPSSVPSSETVAELDARRAA